MDVHQLIEQGESPAAHFRLEEEIFVTGFRIPEEHWRRQVDAH